MQLSKRGRSGPTTAAAMMALALLTSCKGAKAASQPSRAGPAPGGRIAFIRAQADESPPGLYTVDPDGSHVQQVQLAFPPELYSFSVWSPDGSKILISHTFRSKTSGACCLPFRPAIVNPDGSGFKLLKMSYAPSDMDCSVWSPDQTRILCGFGGTKPGVFSVNASDGGDPIRLTTSPYGSSAKGAKDLPTAFSPDGRRFLFIRFKPAPSERNVKAALFVENIDGTALRQITPLGFIHPHDEFAWASWSPDGRSIISTTSGGRLFTVGPDGTGVSIIHLQAGTSEYFAFDPAWSPDGDRIVFGLLPNGYVNPANGNMVFNGAENLYTANPDGSDLVQITNDGEVEHSPSWESSTG
jgi:Tol biopolymer transport system component